MNMSFADAVRRNALTSKATDTEIELKIKTWLRGAVDRQGGRAKRMGNKTLGARTTDLVVSGRCTLSAAPAACHHHHQQMLTALTAATLCLVARITAATTKWPTYAKSCILSPSLTRTALR